MHSETRLILGGLTTLAVATAALVVLPYITIADSAPAPGLEPYTPTALRGREQYIQHGDPRTGDPAAMRGYHVARGVGVGEGCHVRSACIS